MKKFICVILVTVMLLSLCACEKVNTEETTAMPTETTVVETTVQETTVPETTAPEVPEHAFDDYAFVYEEEREKLWEQDIIYFARLCLGEYVVKGHPYLTARLISITDLDNIITQRYFYKAELRDRFITEIHSLIEQLPELTDTQIVFELMRILALLDDAHSALYSDCFEYFPMILEPMEQNGEVGLRLIRIPQEYKDLLYAELIAINGIPVEDVIKGITPYVSTENEFWAKQTIVSIFNEMMICEKGALQAAGVMGAEEDRAQFQFVTEQGEERTVTLEAADYFGEEYWSYRYADCNPVSVGTLSYSQYGNTSYFHQYLQNEKAMFLRLYDCSADAEYRLEDFIVDVDQALRRIGHVDKIIVDIRDNPGGYLNFVDNLIKFLGEADTDHIYILTDNGSFSAGTIFPQRAKAKLDNVTIVGEPTGQTPNFFAGATVLQLRKHNVAFSLSMSYFEGDPSFEEAALMPDILVYQNLTDYQLGIDTVLQTVLDLP